MPIITSINLQKDKKRVNIFLDGEFGFGLDLETYLKNKLKVEQEISEKEIEEIKKTGEYKIFLEKILTFASIRPRSAKEYEDWMRKKKISEIIKPKLIKKITDQGFLNDFEFAKWWLNQRIQFKSKSKRELEFELRTKGIGKDIIAKVLNCEDLNEKQSAKKLLEKNMHRWRRFDKRTAKQKMSMFLSRKGFSWEIIKKLTGKDGMEIDD